MPQSFSMVCRQMSWTISILLQPCKSWSTFWPPSVGQISNCSFTDPLFSANSVSSVFIIVHLIFSLGDFTPLLVSDEYVFLKWWIFYMHRNMFDNPTIFFRLLTSSPSQRDCTCCPAAPSIFLLVHPGDSSELADTEKYFHQALYKTDNYSLARARSLLEASRCPKVLGPTPSSALAPPRPTTMQTVWKHCRFSLPK